MTGKITLEDHFALPDTIDDSERYFTPEIWPKMKHRLVDIHETRIEEMDKHGIETMILSLNAIAVQAVWDTRRAVELARQANDYLAEQVAKNPKRFHGFAALAMQDPDAATRELIRCVTDLGFKGALVNGFSQKDTEDSAIYYDLPRYEAFWATVERLHVPFYLHPREPLPSRSQHYEGHPWFLGSAWSFNAETSIHALRLMASGIFDRYPRLTVILGHLGETIPYNIWRIDHRLRRTPRGIPAKKPLGEYLRHNMYLTTSGQFHTETLAAALSEVGADRILFSVDWPFEDLGHGAEWFDRARIEEADRAKIGRTNAEKLLGLAK